MGEIKESQKGDLEKTAELLRLVHEPAEKREPPKDPEVALVEALGHLINNIVGDDLNALMEGRLSAEDIEKDRKEIISSLNREYPDGLPEIAQIIVGILKGEWNEDNLQSVINLVESFAKKIEQKNKALSLKEEASCDK